MNEPTIQLDVRPEVESFVADVRRHLADLPAEDRDDLTEGLVADLSDLVAEQGPTVLADPATYAAELRAAAGLAPRPRLARPSGSLAELLDTSRDRALAVLNRPGTSAIGDFLESVRPVWWVARAWVAVQVLATAYGGPATPVPTVEGPELGFVLWLVASVASVQLGRRRLWPNRKAPSRLVVLALNVAAVVAAPMVLGQFPASGTYDDPAEETYVPAQGLALDGDPVTNVYPYDSDGKPLVGVQLFDQDGRELQVDWSAAHELSGGTMPFPWYLAAKGRYRELFNVFPLAERSQLDEYEPLPREWSSDRPPRLLAPPLVRVPAVTIPPIVARERAEAQRAAAEEGARRKAAQGTKTDR